MFRLQIIRLPLQMHSRRTRKLLVRVCRRHIAAASFCNYNLNPQNLDEIVPSRRGIVLTFRQWDEFRDVVNYISAFLEVEEVRMRVYNDDLNNQEG